jgi:hypothetical protein
MKKYVYILTFIGLLSLNVLNAGKFTIQNMTPVTLNGVFTQPGGQIFTIKSKESATFNHNGNVGFKVASSLDGTAFVSYQFKEAEKNTNQKFVVDLVPGKGIKKSLRLLTQQL